MDIDSLLQPLSAQSICGEDMSFSTEFDTIQDLRRYDDPSLSQGEWVTDLKTADWPGVVKLCEQLLQQRTRDLRVVGWWAEAKAHLQGYGGLADGVEMAARLCEHLWPHLHPLPEGNDMELRVGSLGWMLAQVATLAKALPVMRLGSRALSLQDMESARVLQQALDRSAEGGPPVSTDGKVTLEMISRAQRDTPSQTLIDTRDAARRLKAALLQLQQVVDGHLGQDGPAFTPAKDAVDAALHGLDRLVRDSGAEGVMTASPDAEAGNPAAASTSSGSAGGASGGPLTNRAQALAQLRQVAEFFRRTEPHSPVAYLADKAARWGDMPLHAWLRAVMKDPNSLSQLEDLLGVEPPPQNNGY
ncbi:type VI secretion system protein TssA [Ideonella paludis]|uniref:Type VI secretion system protein TssA n=1 Tax=Ideonella paludis TaxID=1233411 RepID=A0ABS5E1X8_9BURK|nr:type VI secretion system protein TssA [Ideonella paludis]MBQ0937420.1 type VI secretion system protein TssA [Ideonella paludis]